ncbi:zinc ABC transporter substrate-binding protein [Facklamia sp. DSM 111018]|uniref:Zinc ABC transporter substrate-binding protein n=1 Tax=Facklamia lactis TaxID=2749967 RepID=A0ABS0LS80_9LACT|nr:zinc ABC transporter substrate-binding protein [Facklamia lactis]MBG9987018.1 zinc ABC transporter substrate-binding protein [Facklamia lactis]
MNKRFLSLFLLLCSLTVFFSRSPFGSRIHAQDSSSKPLEIVTSFYPMYAITKQIVGKTHDVKVINSSKGIHGFEPSANDIAAIYNADIFIYHSNTLESWTQNIKANMGDSKVVMVEASRGMDLLKVQGLEEIDEIEGMNTQALYDPHSWLDPIEAGLEAQLIADQLSKIDPDNQATYQDNAEKFNEEAQLLVDKYQDKFSQLTTRTFITQHTAFSYLANRFNLTQLGIAGVSSDIEPSSKKIVEVQEFVKDHNVNTIYVEPTVSDKSARVISEATGTTVVELSPLETDPQNQLSFLENLEQVIETLYSTIEGDLS